MPDILIRGMEYPKSCSRCDFASVVPGEVWCKRAKEIVPEEQTISGNRPTFCPLHELPPHGDLIDLDAKVDCQYYDDEYEEWSIRTVTVEDVLHGCLESMPPVIVPASEPTKSG